MGRGSKRSAVNQIVITLREFRGRNLRALPVQSSSNTALGYRKREEFRAREGVMVRDDVRGSIWAELVAILSVAGAMGALFVPLLVH